MCCARQATVSTHSADKSVVLPMRTNPEPMNTAWHRNTECPVVEANPDAVILVVPDCFEMQRGVRRIRLETSVVAVGEGLNVSGERVETLPKALRCSVFQSSRVEPAR